MGLFSRGGTDPLKGTNLDLGKGESVLAACVDADTGERLVATTQRLLVLAAATEADTVTARLERPWHLVDTGSYDNESDVLTVTWVDRQPALALHPDGHKPFLQAFRERVQASVVTAEALELSEGRTVRIVIRKNLAADRLLDQVVLGAGVRLADPGGRERVMALRHSLREQVGMS